MDSLDEKNRKRREKYRLVNRERVLAECKRYHERNKEKMVAKVRLWRLKNPDKFKAIYKKRNENSKKYRKAWFEKYKIENLYRIVCQREIQSMVRSGKILRPSACQLCGKECRTVGHHPDYSKPKEVIWVCRSCHGTIHFGKEAA
jgi:hypothetical protein